MAIKRQVKIIGEYWFKAVGSLGWGGAVV